MKTVACLLCHLIVYLSGQVTCPVFLCYSIGRYGHDIDMWAQMTNFQRLCRGLEQAGQLKVLE